MRYVTFQIGHKTTAGVVIGQFAYDLAQACFKTFKRPFKFPDLLSFLQAGMHEKVREVEFGRLKEDRLVAYPLREVRICAPIARPPKIICIGLNYRDHAAEQKKEPPSAPLLFSKASNAVIGDGDEIRIPKGVSEKVDHEVELGVVIGKEAWQVSKEDALDHVFGYTIVNDVTARDLQQGDKQWFRGKSCATFAPLGPAIVTPDEIKAEDVGLSLTVNGEVRQTGTTRDLIFGVPALVEYISRCIALEVGDVIATGTPSGVGVFRNPPVFLKPGDTVVATVEGIGSLTNPVV
jgi:2-keto-4-pentenoate hydratase/2-oxohepta-3-ene-1,7-dioic acid hydratase in catechol pathway